MNIKSINGNLSYLKENVPIYHKEQICLSEWFLHEAQCVIFKRTSGAGARQSVLLTMCCQYCAVFIAVFCL